MRWFRRSSNSPRLLSLSPLRYDVTVQTTDVRDNRTNHRDLHKIDSPLHHRSRIDSNSWQRNTSTDDSESENTNYYNVKEMLVVVEKSHHRRSLSETRTSTTAKHPESLQRSARKEAFTSASREKRNPLLDRVKDTKLSCFQSSEILSQFLGDEQTNRFDQQTCHNLDRGNVISSQKSNETKPKSQINIQNIETDQISPTKIEENISVDKQFTPIFQKNGKTPRTRRRNADLNESFNGNSCLSAKIKSMSDRFLKPSTNKLLAKLYKNNETEKAKKSKGKKLRSFSYGALPGLEEFQNRDNPLYIEDDGTIDHSDEILLVNGSTTADGEDGDSGIIVNDSTSSVLENHDRKSVYHSRSASGEQRDTKPDSSSRESWSSDRSSRSFKNVSRRKKPSRRSVSLDRREVLRKYQRQSQTSSEIEVEAPEDTEKQKSAAEGSNVPHTQCKREFKVVRLYRAAPGEELGIFIAKTKLADQGAPGYLIAHIVPDGLADRDANLRVGDEIVNVNGRRLRGLTMPAAREVLCSGPVEVDIVIARQTSRPDTSTRKKPVRMRESSVDYENVLVFPGRNKESCPSSATISVHSSSPEPTSLDSCNDDSLVFPMCSPRTERTYQLIKNGNSMNSKMLQRALAGYSELEPRSCESSLVPLTPKSRTESTLFVNGNFCTLPRRPKSTVCSFHTIIYEKGPGKKSLGFTIVGGKDSPKGALGIFIKSILENGQASEDGRLRAGDEVLAVNGQVCHDMTHTEAVAVFKRIKSGPIALHVCRRTRSKDSSPVTKSCADLLRSSSRDV